MFGWAMEDTSIPQDIVAYCLVYGETMKKGDLVHSEWGKLGILMWPIEGGHLWMVHWQNGNQYDMECCYLHAVKKCP